MQLSVSHHWKDVEATVGKNIINCLRHYWAVARDRALLAPREAVIRKSYASSPRYLPDGRDSFPPHVDVMDDGNSQRFITAILYTQ